MFSLADIQLICGARLLRGVPESLVCGVSTDTRTIQTGDLFIALQGENFDGNAFVAQAFAKEAAAALVSRAPESAVDGAVLLVEDTLKALGQLAAAWRRRFTLPVIAVTGSVGKTTTKEMIAAILAQQGATLKTEVNYNNEIGVPLAVFRLNETHTAAVFELAMRGKGQIRYLAEIVAPAVGVITNIGISHLELLSSPEAIAEAKGELLEVMGADGIAVLNRETPHYGLLKRKAARVITFGLNDGNVRAKEIEYNEKGMSFRMWIPDLLPWEDPESTISEGQWLSIQLPSFGKHNVADALAAAAAAKCVGIDSERIVHGLESYQSLAGRMRIVKAPQGFIIIDDSYNASPDSMRAALNVLADIPGKAKYAALGDMRELGSESAALHRSLGIEVAQVPLGMLVTVGELGKEIGTGAADAQSSAAIVSVPDAQAALEILAGRLQEGDVLLVKASRAIGLEKIVQGLELQG